MQLQCKKREAKKKSEAKAIRRRGNIPAIVYSKGQEGLPVEIDGADFASALRQMPKGQLATTRFTLVDESGAQRQVLVKDIRYHVTTYDIQHLDFVELHDDAIVSVNVPIRPVGLMECVGMKLGGACRQVIRALKVKCLPKDIPSCFDADIRHLKLKQSFRLNEIAIPSAVRPVGDLNEVAIVITKR